ncbi:F-box/kelch-repeat protein At1g23390-like [Rhodamnia argentea]|uniref:F-box/kelch-repeat protein At1g23390-like n=1 Tax=Rhodamnia argentea TaxID=178133 RepID=A0A8B8MT68_9MYRT|nr:F-box/kelch-repeat protein At1g23390-like [Rhodamnia argentea]
MYMNEPCSTTNPIKNLHKFAMKTDTERAAQDEGPPPPPPPLFGDILELTLTRVPLVDLVSASQVSRSWKRAVSSSLRHLNPIRPWLLVHSQSTRTPYAISTRAFDPRSSVWLDISLPQPAKHASTLRSSSSSNLLFILSPSKLSFSSDPLHLTWRHAAPPLVWRADPIVALVGHRLVVAGGAFDFDDDPLAVETYDLRAGAWEACGSTMPALLKDSSASAWLSVTADEDKMYVTDKLSGVTHSYDPEADAWHGPYDLRPHRDVYCCVIGFASGRLILVGLLGCEENVKGVKAWEVERGTWRAREIGEMPPGMVRKMKGERFCASSMSACGAGDFVYLNRDSDPGTAVWCEVVGGGDCRWGRAESPAASGGRGPAERVVFTSSNVGMSELKQALATGDPRNVIRST